MFFFFVFFSSISLLCSTYVEFRLVFMLFSILARAIVMRTCDFVGSTRVFMHFTESNV